MRIKLSFIVMIPSVGMSMNAYTDDFLNFLMKWNIRSFMAIFICIYFILNRNYKYVYKDCKALQDVQGFWKKNEVTFRWAFYYWSAITFFYRSFQRYGTEASRKMTRAIRPLSILCSLSPPPAWKEHGDWELRYACDSNSFGESGKQSK